MLNNAKTAKKKSQRRETKVCSFSEVSSILNIALALSHNPDIRKLLPLRKFGGTRMELACRNPLQLKIYNLHILDTDFIKAKLKYLL